MKETDIVALLGSVTPPGRLHSAVRAGLERAAAAGLSVQMVNLRDLQLDFADGRPVTQLSDDTGRLVEAVGAARGVLLATPVYRATLTGALKNALDLLPVEALQAKPAGIVSMGATLHHTLGAESHLRDILAWFGAIAAPTAVYLCSSDFKDGVLSEERAQEVDALIATIAALATRLRPDQLGPTPLAARR